MTVNKLQRDKFYNNRIPLSFLHFQCIAPEERTHLPQLTNSTHDRSYQDSEHIYRDIFHCRLHNDLFYLQNHPQPSMPLTQKIKKIKITIRTIFRQNAIPAFNHRTIQIFWFVLAFRTLIILKWFHTRYTIFMTLLTNIAFINGHLIWTFSKTLMYFSQDIIFCFTGYLVICAILGKNADSSRYYWPI